ncbi:hypothetical protein J2X31_002415 [Flavobacterium arsenatis]|uniref:Outer membrane protein beta-barrel domain-containing protein n=1 Tax=Flavobacterium arsenatis TaxID=1484332 RepID=A0ABU1TRB8_9FLAO|nr:DUF6048 family protein [Flavobacterium arsenatis]MDR6968392.1 hypothetical protein [Flavobacterium arsenatis]
MKPISTYIFFSSILILCSSSIVAQEKKTDSLATPVVAQRYGIRFGVDLLKIARSVYDKDYKGFEIVGDYRLAKKYYLAGEIGNENKTTDEDQVNFTTKGTFFKVGFDYNMHENWLDLENMIHVGLRYGVSSFSQEINNYQIYNPNPYWGQLPATNGGAQFDGLSAQWIEVVVGMKTRVFDNVFVGFSFRMNRLVSNKQPGGFDNLYIPGFNRTYDGDFGVGFNYTVSYLLPIYKKKNVPIVEEKK